MSFINRVLMAAVLAAGLWSPTAQAQDKTLRIGFQKYGTLANEVAPQARAATGCGIGVL